MNGRLKLIEQQLIGIDSAAFQNLCDVYLALRAQRFGSFNRTGSQLGKQKTVPGTPDTYYRLEDGSLRFVEHTTQASELTRKIKEDIDNCLDPSKTGVPINEISKIIICFNSRLKIKEETELTYYANSKNVKIELIGLDCLAIEIYSKYPILAKDILGLTLDTGQLLPLQNFVEEYSNKAGSLSTPLDNVFLHREDELAEIGSVLANNDLLIIAGPPGVGKTKIGLEAVKYYLAENSDYSAFAISNKDQDISDDLKILLQREKNYILLVDDANRQFPNFKQLLGIFREKRKGNIKLLITVRDYALEDVKNECLDYSIQIITLLKFTDKEITKLISSDSLGIKIPKYQRRIMEIADGNPRIAVMASRLALQDQTNFLYGEGDKIFKLYDSYFRTFIKDNNFLGNETVLKTLGIISFFFTLDIADKELIGSILSQFRLDYYNFHEAIHELEKRELIETRYNHVRISEQIMSTYFFYKVFIKDEVLSFSTLFFAYFPRYKHRFSDTVIPSNNTFGYENVQKKINGTLDEYFQAVFSEEIKTMDFFDLFWAYKPEEMLNYFYKRIQDLPEPITPTYHSENDPGIYGQDKDEILDLLSNLFVYYTENFTPALELAFKYCRKKPNALPVLVRKIKERLVFDKEDFENNFIRQTELFNLLISQLNNKTPQYISAFFDLSKIFLGHSFEVVKIERKRSYQFYQSRLPNNETIRGFREEIWTALFENYEKYPEEVFSVIAQFKPGFKNARPEILEFDLSFLVPFIIEKLNPDDFQNIHFVNEFVHWLNVMELKDRSYQKLIKIFQSEEYEYFKKLDWTSSGGKKRNDFTNYKEFEKQKEEEIRTSFVFNSETEFPKLISLIINTLSLGGNSSWIISKGLNIVIEENFLRNKELGIKLLEIILKDYPGQLEPLFKPVRTIIQKSTDWALRLWNLLKNMNRSYKLDWQLSFFKWLPIEYVDSFYRKELFETIESIDVNCYLEFETLGKFFHNQPSETQNKIGVIHPAEDILCSIYIKNENENLKIGVSNGFFKIRSGSSKINYDILKLSYLQQEKMFGHYFDIDRAGMKSLLHINPKFLIEYITEFYTGKDQFSLRNSDIRLHFAWDLENSCDLIEKSLIIITDNNYYSGIGEYYSVIFFHELNDTQKNKAQKFILKFISKYHIEPAKMNSIFDAIRHTMNEFFETAFLHYLSLNTSVEAFEKVWWRGNGGTSFGGTIIGDIEGEEWQRILNTVKKSENQVDLIPIKAFIKEQIYLAIRSGDCQRKRRFIDPGGW